MSKNLFITEKPSVASQFSQALHENMRRGDGFFEGDSSVITWCVGHLVSMSYPEEYDPALKMWRYDTIPFIPDTYKYQVIDNVKKQFAIVKGLLTRDDIACIYICTDSGREGEYIYRLVDMMAEVPKDKPRKRVWIDSQTEEEIARGIREAKDWSAYDNLSDAAYLRAQEDYLMGINFTRALTLKYAKKCAQLLGMERLTVTVGRVMTCVLGIVVRREQEIRNFVKTPFYKVVMKADMGGEEAELLWKVSETSEFMGSPLLYKDNGFRERAAAEKLITDLESSGDKTAEVTEISRKTEKKNPPLLFNLAELQNVCSKLFKISPADTLNIAQELYEKKLTTYPRTDARVLSTAVCKEINKNISGLKSYPMLSAESAEVLVGGAWKNIAKTKYCNDKAITDHYAIIPTGQGLGNLGSLSKLSADVYELICRRFLSIFYPAAVYKKTMITALEVRETFTASYKVLEDEGYMKVFNCSFQNRNEQNEDKADKPEDKPDDKSDGNDDDEDQTADETLKKALETLKKGDKLNVNSHEIKEGETTPPKRYTSGSIILTMENAGQFIEDEELRSQIKGSGIGTSATRAEILTKLQTIGYLNLNKKTQVITPTILGEMIYYIVNGSIPALLDAKLTASWEKGLSGVADGSITSDDYKDKLSRFVTVKTNEVKGKYNSDGLDAVYRFISPYYKNADKGEKSKKADKAKADSAT
ncbi:MAG: type IA DNA topoisomerase [Lachnospiraceae bacterium]|nr:type IA DNA topoisomerase [Lachnospiraceae bacterium]